MIRNAKRYKIFCCIKFVKIFEADHEVCREKVVKLPSLLRKLLVCEYCKTESKKSN